MTSAAPARGGSRTTTSNRSGPPVAARARRSTARAAGSFCHLPRRMRAQALAQPRGGRPIALDGDAGARDRGQVAREVAVAGIELEHAQAVGAGGFAHQAAQRLVLHRVGLGEAGRRRVRVVDGDAGDRRLTDERPAGRGEERPIGARPAVTASSTAPSPHQARDRALFADERRRARAAPPASPRRAWDRAPDSARRRRSRASAVRRIRSRRRARVMRARVR